jgi:hypothetical protein
MTGKSEVALKTPWAEKRSQFSVLTTDWTIGVRSPTVAEGVFCSFCFHTDSGAHPASYTVGTGGLFPGCKARPERESDDSRPSSVEVKKVQKLYLLSPQAPSVASSGATLPFTLKRPTSTYISTCIVGSAVHSLVISLLRKAPLNLCYSVNSFR